MTNGQMKKIERKKKIERWVKGKNQERKKSRKIKLKEGRNQRK